MNLDNLKSKYLGKKIHIITHSLDRWGIVEHISQSGLLFGTWGPDYVNPETDYVSLED